MFHRRDFWSYCERGNKWNYYKKITSIQLTHGLNFLKRCWILSNAHPEGIAGSSIADLRYEKMMKSALNLKSADADLQAAPEDDAYDRTLKKQRSQWGAAAF